MNKLQEISSQPDYDSKASSFSKLIIATFFISYVYMILTTSSKTGWIGLVIFLFAGLFISSIVIAMPFFILKRIFQKISIAIVIISIFTTFFVTKAVFNWVFDEPKTTTTSVLPDKYLKDKEFFVNSLKKHSEAAEVTNDKFITKSTKEIDEKILSLEKESLENGIKVSDEFLDYLHQDLKINYKNYFIESRKLYIEGLNITDNENLSLEKQLESLNLFKKWGDWWDKNNDKILEKIL
jgi:hypothetical protein